ncbi:methionine--tRNA ligase [Candidatus Woesearchaeota archaeon]|nr:MAG: methionine--tRNA ligase [Candidatus Woesearchaeota archaeon]
MARKVLVTSALPYVNNVPHLGNLIGCVLSADVFARFCRSFGYETLFVCGLDEHGTTTETKAKEEGVSPKELCDKYAALHKKVYAWFGCSFDAFGRTSSPVHHEVTKEIFLKVHQHGFVFEKEVEQLYSEKSKMFLADRYVEGTCPFCGYDKAKGDQCESCGRVLNATDLVNPRAVIDGSVPVKKKTRHLFLDLPKLQRQLESWVEKQSKEGFWSENAVRQTKAWFKEGLSPRAITRDLSWGIPVPLKGFEGKVFYVWFDAPIGYISITKEARSDWAAWWKDVQGVRLVQFMAKDNIPFHTILFPATLMAADDGFVLLDHINATEYLNYEAGKFSKSRGVGVFGDDAMASGIPADVWRYYLLANRPETSDTTFTWNDFGEKLNNELVATLGNFVNRTLVFVQRFYGGVVPEPSSGVGDSAVLKDWRGRIEEITELLHKVKLKDALKKVMLLAGEGNAFFQRSEPWRARKEAPEQAATALYLLVHLVKDLAIVMEPFLPFTAQRLWGMLGLDRRAWRDAGQLSIQPGHTIGKPEVLFEKVDNALLASFKQRFAGRRKEGGRGERVVAAAEKAASEAPAAGSAPKALSLRVGRIVRVEKHPSAEKLFVETVDFGGEQRTIVSGLVGLYTPEELVGKNIIVVWNLKPAKLRGVVSEGMLLAAEEDTKEGGCEVLFVPGAEVGTFVRGDEACAPISIDEFFKHELVVRNGVVFVDGEQLMAGGVVVRTVTVLNGVVR